MAQKPLKKKSSSVIKPQKKVGAQKRKNIPTLGHAPGGGGDGGGATFRFAAKLVKKQANKFQNLIESEMAAKVQNAGDASSFKAAGSDGFNVVRIDRQLLGHSQMGKKQRKAGKKKGGGKQKK